jgi:hypothetical protein
VCSRLRNGERWVTDGLLLALNYGWCYNKGQHPKTTDARWELFEDSVNLCSEHMYTEEQCKKISDAMTYEQENLFFE